jgi:hypothetical protein
MITLATLPRPLPPQRAGFELALGPAIAYGNGLP